MMPAMRATAKHVALLCPAAADQRNAVAGSRTTRNSAVAVRSVTGLVPTSTIAAWPRASNGKNPGSCRLPVSSARVAAVTSAWRIRLSPTRKHACPLRPGVEVGVPDAALRDQEAALGYQRRESLRGREVGAKVLRSRLLMPISDVSRPSTRSISRGSCTSASTSMSRARASASLARLGVGERSKDEQDAVGPHRAALRDLPRIEDEVLAQHRQIDRGARGHQMSGALEMRRVGQHREARRATSR